MFGLSFNILDPIDPIMNGIVDSLKIKRDSINIDSLLISLRKNRECTMINPKFDIESYNSKLKNIPIMIKDIQLGSLYINFPKSFMTAPTIFKLSDIQLDLQFYKNEQVPEKEIAKAASSSYSALMKAMNCFIKNIKLEFNNLHMRIFIGDNVEYCLMIQQIKFDVNEKELINDKDKLKLAFFHKKQITIKKILLKQHNEENDKLFFNNNETTTLANQISVYMNTNTFFINHNDIIINFEHSLSEKELIIHNHSSPLSFECIANKSQITTMIQSLELLKHFFIKNQPLEESTSQEALTPLQETKKAQDIMGIPINKQTIDITMSSSYFAIIDNQQNPKPKIWMIYDNYFKSYYDLKETPTGNSEFIQKHLLYHDENFLYVYLDNFAMLHSYNTIEKESEGTGSIKDIEVKFIQPNQVKNKKDILIIKNTEANDVDKLFNENYFKFFFAVIKFGAYYYQIVNLNKIDLTIKGKTISIIINQIACDCNIIVLSHLIYLFQVNKLIQINYDEGKNIIKDIDNKQSLIIELNVKLINCRIQTNKKSLKLYQKFYEIYYKKDDANVNGNDNKEKLYYNEIIQQQLSVTITNIQLRHTSKTTLISYYKLLCCYVNNNLIYPLLLQNNSINTANDNYLIKINESTEKNLKLNIMSIIISFDQILLFINPLLGKKVLSYVQLFIYSLNMFSCFIKMKPVVSLEKNYLKEIKIDCKVNEIQLISFSSIELPKQKKDINKLIVDNEKIFKLLVNPMIKFKIEDFYMKSTINDQSQHVEFSIRDMKLMIKKIDNRFTKDNAAYQMFVENQKEEDKFEYIIYNPSLMKTECFNASIDIIIKKKIANELPEGGIIVEDQEEDFAIFISQRKPINSVLSTTIQGSVKFDNIAIVPLPLRLNELLDEFDIAKVESSQLNFNIGKIFNNSSETIEIIAYKKFASNNDKVVENNQKSMINYDITISIENILIDLFSEEIRMNEYIDTENEDINHNKNKMRLITEITSLSIYISNRNKKDISTLALKIHQLNTIFMKNLDLLKESSMLLIGKNNAIAAPDSYWRKIGFAEILSCQDMRFDSNKSISNIFIMSIELFFCFDSLRFLSKFVSNIGKNIKTIKALFDNIIEDDQESIMTDIYQFKDAGNDIEYRSIGQYSHERFINKYELLQENKKAKREVKIITDSRGGLNKKSDIPLQLGLFICSIKISLFQGEDFNFQGRYISEISGGVSNITPNAELVDDNNGSKLILLKDHLRESENYFNNNNRETQAPIENINKRNYSNSIILSIDKLEVKSSYYETTDMILSLYISIQNILIDDKLSNTRFKKILSRYAFEDIQNIFFAAKIDIFVNSNGQNDIKGIIDLTPITIYLDQLTLKFLLDFFYYDQLGLTPKTEIANEVKDLNPANTNEQILETQTISQINPVLLKPKSRLHSNVSGYIISRLIINSFFINLNYYPRNFPILSNQSDSKMDAINVVSIEDMKITLKEVKITTIVPLEKLSLILSEHWKDDILKNQIISSYIKAIPIMRNFHHAFCGLVAIVQIPVNSYDNNIPIEQSLVSGVRCFVANTSTELLKFGESVSGFFKKIARVDNNSDNGYRQLLYKIDKSNKRRDEYYLKSI